MSTISVSETQCVVCGSQQSTFVASGTEFLYQTTTDVFTWVQCIDCKHLYLNPRPLESELSVIYPSNLLNYEINENDFDWKIKSLIDRLFIRKISSQVEIKRVLDIGCADGSLLKNIRRELGKEIILEGSELSPVATSALKINDVKIHYGQIQSLDLKPGDYDVIFMQQVIEHLLDPKGDLQFLISLLSPQGLLVIETPIQDSWDQRFFQTFSSGSWEGFHIPRHFNIWTVEGFRMMVEASGGILLNATRKPKPVHWSVSFQNHFKRTGIDSLVSFFSLRNVAVLGFFYLIDLAQILCGKGSDVRYVVRRIP